MRLEDEWIRGMLDYHKYRGADCYDNIDPFKFASGPDSCNMVFPIGATEVTNESIK